jgi:hypothetical protein
MEHVINIDDISIRIKAEARRIYFLLSTRTGLTGRQDVVLKGDFE